MDPGEIITETRQNGTAAEVSLTLTHRPTGLAVWILAPDTPEVRAQLLSELATKIKNTR